MNTRVYIVEDDPLVVRELELVIRAIGYDVVGTASNEQDAMAGIDALQPDLVCIDIDLGRGGSGLNVASHLRSAHGIPFVFITAFYDDHILAAARALNPAAYVVKPFRDADIRANLALALQKRPALHAEPLAEDLFLRTGNEAVRIAPDDIAYIQGDDNYSRVVLQSGKTIMLSTTLKVLEEKLPGQYFTRIHKQYIVNRRNITSLQGSTLYLNEKAFPIGKAYRQKLLQSITLL